MKNQSIPLSQIKVNDNFWGKIQELVQDVVIPHQADILEDKSSVGEKSYAVQNIRIAAGEAEGEFYGMPWQDSDVAKWLEAASYSIAIKSDAALEARMDEVIRLIGKAQHPDGYLNTFFTLKEQDQKWKNLRDRHELYCAGHMIEAGVAHHLATGKDSLLKIVIKLADNVCNRFGYNKTRGIPGHEEIELALLRLYRITGTKEYLETAKYFIDDRGTSPNYFTEETRLNRPHEQPYTLINAMYNQSHKPVREQDEAVGHSVRALYLYTAMADMAAETNDKELYNVCVTLMNNMLDKKIYITGGLGSTFHGEAFSPAYDLPNDTMYAETCASIAMCFFARKILEIKPSGVIADALERQLFNVVLASMQMDGKRFFYVNPLEVIPGISGESPTHKHALPTRPEWFACACCPPNVARLLLSLGRYAWGEGEDTIYSHFFLGGTAEHKHAKIECQTGYPWNGDTKFTINPTKPDFTFAIHIPSWCRNVKVLINGEPFSASPADGYIHIKRTWQQGDTVEIKSDLPVLRIYSNLKVSNNAEKVCLQRGPIVYCLEEADNDNTLAAVGFSPTEKVNITDGEGALSGMKVLKINGQRRQSQSTALYTEKQAELKPQQITAIPYYAWGNRTKGEMRVWVNEL